MRIAEILARANQGSNRGRVAELLVAADLSSRGYIVSFPSAESAFDLIASRGTRDIRIQVKCAYAKGSGAVVHTSRTIGRRREPWQYAIGDFEFFGVVVPEEGIFYLPHDGSWKSHQPINDDVRTYTELPA